MNADRPFSVPSLPYANHVSRLPSSLPHAEPAELEPALPGAFLAALDLAIQTVRHADNAHPAGPGPGGAAGPPSYNVLLPLAHVHVVPRRREAHVLAATREPLAVNALGFAGMLLVKSARERAAVAAEGVGAIFTCVSFSTRVRRC